MQYKVMYYCSRTPENSSVRTYNSQNNSNLLMNYYFINYYDTEILYINLLNINQTLGYLMGIFSLVFFSQYFTAFIIE